MNAGDRTPHAQHLAELHRPRTRPGSVRRMTVLPSSNRPISPPRATSGAGSRVRLSSALPVLVIRSSKTFPSARHQTRRPSRRRFGRPPCPYGRPSARCAQRARRPCALPLQTRARAFRVGSRAQQYVPGSENGRGDNRRREVEDRVVSAFEAGGLRLADQLRDRCRSTVRLQEEAVLDPSKGVGLAVNRLTKMSSLSSMGRIPGLSVRMKN